MGSLPDCLSKVDSACKPIMDADGMLIWVARVYVMVCLFRLFQNCAVYNATKHCTIYYLQAYLIDISFIRFTAIRESLDLESPGTGSSLNSLTHIFDGEIQEVAPAHVDDMSEYFRKTSMLAAVSDSYQFMMSTNLTCETKSSSPVAMLGYLSEPFTFSSQLNTSSHMGFCSCIRLPAKL